MLLLQLLLLSPVCAGRSLPQSIPPLCARRSKKCGFFRLSTPGGLTLVQRCNLRGFHMHPDTHTGQELYELCGHVYLNPRAKHTVIDLR